MTALELVRHELRHYEYELASDLCLARYLNVLHIQFLIWYPRHTCTSYYVPDMVMIRVRGAQYRSQRIYNS